MLGTRDEDEEEPYKNAIDNWIYIYDSYKANVDSKRKTAAEKKIKRN